MVRTLVPVEILEGETVAPGIIELLAPAEVVLLGYHRIPEQTTPGQARMSFEEQATAKLDDIAEAFTDAGASVETRLVFTHDPEQTFERVAAETEADAVVHGNPAMAAEDLLVALHGQVAAERIGSVVAGLVDGRDIGVSLVEIAGPEADTLNLRERAERALVEGGVDADNITGEVIRTTTPIKAIVEAAQGMDAIVLGERAPSWREMVFGDFEDRVADASLGAVLVVRSPAEADADAE
jgi:hypothetical protein